MNELLALLSSVRDVPDWLKTTVMLVLFVVVFYFFLIHPRLKKSKEEERYHKGLQKGDRVMTAGGIHGTVDSINGDYAQIEVATNTRIKVQLSTLTPIPERKAK